MGIIICRKSSWIFLRTCQIRFIYVLQQLLCITFLCLPRRLNAMLGEYKNMIAPLPAPVAPMLKPFTDRVDEAIKPGVVSLTWSSIKINECECL